MEHNLFRDTEMLAYTFHLLARGESASQQISFKEHNATILSNT